jgi:hypothetical protein
MIASIARTLTLACYARPSLYTSDVARRLRPILAGACAAMLMLGAALPTVAAETAPIQGSRIQVLHKHVRPVVTGGEAKRVGPLESTYRMKLSITLPLRNESELKSLLTRLSDPKSPDLAAGNSCTIDVQFEPTGSGPPEATARVGSSVLGLTGTAAFGAGVGTLAPTFLAFVNQVVGTNAVLSASVTNTGSAAISSALFRGMKKGAQRGI